MSTELTPEIQAALAPEISGNTVYVLVGNPWRGDDGAATFIAGRLRNARADAFIIDAGNRPENCIERIISLNPAKTVFIDAADFGAQAGAVRLLAMHDVARDSISTHAFPLPVLARLIEEELGSATAMIGIQIHSACLGQGMHAAVVRAAERLIDYLNARLDAGP